MNYKRVVLIGAESTGKTTLANDLARYFSTKWIPEYARTYVENLGRNYDYQDVVNIANRQIVQETDFLHGVNKFLFIDTDLIITKIWFKEVFSSVPPWIDTYIQKLVPDLYLLCMPDLPWVIDSVRENNGERRLYLHEIYKNEILKLKCNYVEISGSGSERFNCAIEAVKSIK